jgi:hypothetical protein
MKRIRSFVDFINEIKLPNKKWVDWDLSLLDDEALALIWDMYTKTYAAEGLDFSADDKSELAKKYKATHLIDVDKDSKPDAFIIYKSTRWGNKLALMGSDGTREAKSVLVKKLLELVNTKGWFVEASKKMESILKSNDINVIEDPGFIIDIVGDRKKPIMLKDGYFTRLLSKANKRITKRFYGKIK